MPTQKKAGSKKAAPQGQESGSITFSTRFTEEQRDRIVAAAEVRGWTPSNLMRVATIEKASYILNTSRQTRFDFKGLATRVAKQLIDPEAWSVGPEGELGDLSDFVSEYSVDSLSLQDIQILKQAARLGGSELLNLIIETCESLRAPDRKDLPEPVDPI